jgi:hypothetical protein
MAMTLAREESVKIAAFEIHTEEKLRIKAANRRSVKRKSPTPRDRRPGIGNSKSAEGEKREHPRMRRVPPPFIVFPLAE